MTGTLMIPNSFQTPNDLVDQFMELLTPEEFKVLIYAVRHILGWKTKIASRKASISLTQFEAGFEHDGRHFGGCGLSRPKIVVALTALVDFGLMQKMGNATKDGQAWKLTFDDPDVIDMDRLHARAEQTAQQSAQRVAKAAVASADKRRTSTTAVPLNQYDSRTGISTTAVPLTSTTVVHNETHVIKPIETHDSADAPTAVSAPPVASVAKSKQPHVAIIEDGYLAALEELHRKPIEADAIKRRARIARAIVESGYTARQVYDCTLSVYGATGDPWMQNRKKPISLEEVAAILPTWAESCKPLQRIDYGNLGTSEDQLKRTLAMRDELFARAAAGEFPDVLPDNKKDAA